MSLTCEHSVAARILDIDNIGTELLDFNNHILGLHVETILPPEETERTSRTDPDSVDGTFPYTRKRNDGVLVLSQHVHGDTWPQCEARWEATRPHWDLDFFYLQTEVNGVTRTWIAERPDVTPEAVTADVIAGRWLTYVLRFRVQPNPTVSIV